jgi:TPR repeat protein
MGQAFLYASKACELGHTYGCINAAKQLETGDGVPADPEGAAELKEKARKLHTKRK